MDTRSRAWKEGDSSWGKPIGWKAGKDPPLTSSTKFAEHLLCARQYAGLSSPGWEMKALLCEELTAQWAEDLLCARFLLPGSLTTTWEVRVMVPILQVWKLRPHSSKRHSWDSFFGLEDPKFAHHERFV